MWWLHQHQLKSGNVNTRRKAAEFFRERPHAGALKALASGAKDADSQVRSACVAALAKLKDARRFEPLIEALADPDAEVVRCALPGLAECSDPRALMGVRSLLRHREASVRAMAAQLLDRREWAPENDDEQAWLDVARGQFTRAAGRGSACLPALQNAIENGPFNIAVAAVHSLSEIGGPEIVGSLRTGLKSKDAAVCVAAIEVVSRTMRTETGESIIELLNNAEPRIRLAAAEAVAVLKLRDASSALVPLLADEAWDVRRAAAEALGRLRDQGAMEPLCEALSDPDTDVQEAAAIALASLGNRRAIAPLVRALASEASGVRRLCAAALSRIDQNWTETPEAQLAADELCTTLTNKDSNTRFFVRQAFGPLFHDRTARNAPAASAGPGFEDGNRQRFAINSLINLLSDDDTDVRQAAVEALGRIGESKAESALVRMTSDPSPDVSNAAKQALNSVRERIV